ncbi:MAG: choice-of-anchor tandem repeat GloVer-containing protein, partial [Chthoniobacteraceae bacterium]
GDVQLAAADGGYYALGGANGAYAGNSTDGDPNAVSFKDGPIVSRIAGDGTVTRLTADFTGEGTTPSSGLVTGADGNLYGVTQQGGRWNRGAVYRFDTTTRAPVIIHSLAAGEGQNPTGTLAVDPAGKLYGIVAERTPTRDQEGVPTTPSPGGIFACTTAGAYSLQATFPLSPFDRHDRTLDDRDLGPDLGGRLAVGSDGALYGTREIRVASDYKTVAFRVADSTYKEVAKLGNSFAVSQPIAGPDGALYFSHQGDSGELVRLAAPGKLTRKSAPKDIRFEGDRLVLGLDGQLYHASGDELAFYRIDPSKLAISPLRGLREFHQDEDTYPYFLFVGIIEGLMRGPDGKFYGVRLATDHDTGGDVRRVFVATTEGGIRVLGDLLTPPNLNPGGSSRSRPTLALGPDGFLYGIAAKGGERGGGFIYRAPLDGGNTAPVAQDDVIDTGTGYLTEINVSANDPDADADGDIPFLKSFTQPTSGKVINFGAGGRPGFYYQAGKSFTGTDTFTYTVSDGFGGTSTATVTIRNPYFTSGGFYSGVLTAPDGTPYATIAGKFSSGFGSFSGKLTILPGHFYSSSKKQSVQLFVDPKTLTGGGSFGLTPEFAETITLLSPGLLQIAVTEGAVTYTATLGRQSGVLPPSITLGQHTVLFNLPSAVPGDGLPGGIGWAAGKVAKKGKVRLAGQLPDGTKFSFGGTVAEDGRLSFFVPLYAKPKGYLAGVVDFSTAKTTHQLGTLRWVKPKPDHPGTQLYPNGFDTMLGAVGAPYAPPLKGKSALHGGTIPVAYTFSAGYRGHAALLEKGLTVDAADKTLVTTPGEDALKLTLARTTGVVSGSFTSPSEAGALRKFTGVLFQPDATAHGLFPGASATGSGLLHAAP